MPFLLFLMLITSMLAPITGGGQGTTSPPTEDTATATDASFHRRNRCVYRVISDKKYLCDYIYLICEYISFLSRLLIILICLSC
jgi:hypothetical protein